MRNLGYIVIVFLGFACSKANKSVSTEKNVLNSYIEEISFKSKIDNYEALTTQKLYEYFDLMKLKHKHPEFEQDIVKQLKRFELDSKVSISYDEGSKITDVGQIDEVLKLSDSIFKIRLKFNIQTGEETKVDTIQAIIYSKTIILESKEIKSNTVRFIK